MARVPLLFVALVAALATGAAAVVFSPRTNTSACPDHAFKVRVYDADYCGARQRRGRVGRADGSQFTRIRRSVPEHARVRGLRHAVQQRLLPHVAMHHRLSHHLHRVHVHADG